MSIGRGRRITIISCTASEGGVTVSLRRVMVSGVADCLMVRMERGSVVLSGVWSLPAGSRAPPGRKRGERVSVYG